MKSVGWKAAVALVPLFLWACGGGGGGSSGSGTASSSPSSTTPVNLSSLNLYTVAQGDSRTYQITSGGSTYILQEDVSAGPDAGGMYVVTQTDYSTSQVTNSSYRLTTAGVYDLDPTGGELTSAAAAQIGEALMYANTLPANGAARSQSWTGSLGQDWDGDGSNDSFFVAIEQRLLSTSEAITLNSSNDTVSRSVHLRTVFTMTYRPTRAGVAEVTLVATADEYLLPGWGLIKGVYSAVDGRGASVGSETRELISGTVSGRRWIDSAPDGPLDVKRVAVPHSDLVYDATRERYYASVNSPDPTLANRIAVIDARSGQLTYSASLGITPGALAVSKDGRHLYVGSMSSGELLRLSLPGLVEVDRLTLPTRVPGGNTQFDAIPVNYVKAGLIAPSPTDASVIAVQLCWADFRLPGSACGITEIAVVLVRDMVLQPRWPSRVYPQSMTYSRQLIFNEAGTVLHEFQPSGLIGDAVVGPGYSVASDGLVDLAASATPANGAQSLFAASAGGYLFTGPLIYQSDTLQLVGSMNSLGCVQSSDGGRPMCLVVDASKSELQVASVRVVQRTLGTAVPVARGNYTIPQRVVPGLTHQLGLSYPSDVLSGQPQQVVLMTDERLP